MKIPGVFTFLLLVFLSCKNNVKREPIRNIAGDYQILDSQVYKGADLRLRFLDENAYFVELNEAGGVGKMKDGVLKGIFKNKHGEGAPFTLEVTKSRVFVLRVKNRTLSFIKKS